MTKSICISLDVSHLSQSSRLLVPAHIGNSSGQPRRQPLKLHRGLRSHVTVAVDVPSALVGDHDEYGTSVFAAGVTALEFARVELARSGLGKVELDRLTTAHVAIRKVTVTYLLRFASHAATLSFSQAMTHHATLLGLNIRADDCACTVEYRGQIPDKRPSAASQSSNEVVLTKVSRPWQQLVRLELELGSDYLSGRGWTALDSWRQAHAENRYATIFNENVRGLFRLDVDCRYDEPGQEVYERLSPFAADLLREYMAGKDPKTCGRFPPGGKWGRANKKELKRLREEILDQSGIDIMIPWTSFQCLRPTLLVNKLNYPGDYHPSEEHAPRRFCQANWPKLLQDMRAAYEAAASDM